MDSKRKTIDSIEHTYEGKIVEVSTCSGPYELDSAN